MAGIAQMTQEKREAVAQRDNLAAMLRRMVWQIDKTTGDTSLKVLAGKTRELLKQYGLEGSPLRDGGDTA